MIQKIQRITPAKPPASRQHPDKRKPKNQKRSGESFQDFLERAKRDRKPHPTKGEK